MSPALLRSIQICQLALAFGRVERVTRHEDGVRPETDTDHTIMLCLLACDLAVSLDLWLDVGLVCQLSVVHDLVERYANDVQTLTIDAQGRKEKAEREAAALVRIRSEFGESSWICRTLELYEHQGCPEARFVRVLDKVTPKLTHLLNGCIAAKALVDFDGFVASHDAQAKKLLEEYSDVDSEIHALLREAMDASEKEWKEGASP